VFATLEEPDPASGLYFADFGKDCVLRQVIAGPICMLTEGELREAIGTQHRRVALTKARVAFKSFRVVENRSGFLKK
jgi:hypothetical protein